MALTPVADALNRATPGFDALVGALQSTTDRIVANQQFAKEVQARKDFALFQADLQIESEIELFKRLSPLKLEEKRADLKISSDAELALADDLIPIKVREFDALEGAAVPYKEDDAGRQVASQKEIDDNRHRNTQAEIRLRAELNPPQGRSQASVVKDYKDEIRTELPFASKWHDVQLPRETEDGEEELPYIVDINGEQYSLPSYGDWRMFMRRENTRYAEIDRLERAKESIENIAPGTTADPNTLGLDEINTLLGKLRSAGSYSLPTSQENLIKYNELMKEVSGTTIARITEPQREAKNNFYNQFNTLRVTDQFTFDTNRLNNPDDSMYIGNLFERFKSDDKVEKEIALFLSERLSLNQIHNRLVEATEDSEDGASNIVPVMLTNFQLIEPGSPPLPQNLIPNWYFDPSGDGQIQNAFLNPQEMARKIINKFKETNPEAVANGNMYNPAGPRVQAREQNNK